MATVELRIELPTYARSFSIQILDTCTILDVKQEISRLCPGRPRVDGQRLIWRGRFLTDDEKVESIWKLPHEPRIVHLVVHPSAWVSGPPTVQATSDLRTKFGPELTPPIHTFHHTQPMASLTTRPNNTPQLSPFIVAKHQGALTALTKGYTDINTIPSMREEALKLLESNGWSWPTILDEEYPEPTPGGLEYEQICIGGIPHLSLKDPDAHPTPFQSHALRVLGYTFSILSKELRREPQSQSTIMQTISERQTVPNIPHINDLLQQMGLPPLRNVPNANVVRNRVQGLPVNPLQDMAIRPLLAPLFMLILRTSLLLYFVAPTRKPIFGVLILAWMLYEIWQPIRNNLLRQLQPNEQAAQQNGIQGQADPGQAGAGQADIAPAAPGLLNNRPPLQGAPPHQALIEMLGNMNIESEQQILAQARHENTMEPSLRHKFVTFIGLLTTTLHPAIWNQRRVALRRREGTIRTEINMREGEARMDVEDEEARRNEERAEAARTALREVHGRRPEWIQRYTERVMSGEWVDDAD